MQCPPTRPGAKGWKFHLVPAAASTSRVSMPIRPKIRASSFIRAMLRSRCVFSMTFAASATRIDATRWTPAVTTDSYTPATTSRVVASCPATIFGIRVKTRSRSPGLMRSGE